MKHPPPFPRVRAKCKSFQPEDLFLPDGIRNGDEGQVVGYTLSGPYDGTVEKKTLCAMVWFDKRGTSDLVYAECVEEID